MSGFAKFHVTALAEGDALSTRKAAQPTGLATVNNDQMLGERSLLKYVITYTFKIATLTTAVS